MASPRAQGLISDYETNTWLIHRHIDGISDSESLLQWPFEANCLNWVVGHILSRRNSALEALGLAPLWDEATAAMYITGSPTATDASKARPLSLMMADLDRSQREIEAGLQKATEADLDRMVTNDRGTKPASEHLKGFHWHETYHIGQLDLIQAYIKSRR